MKCMFSKIKNFCFYFKISHAKVIDQNAFRDTYGRKLRSFLFRGGWIIVTDVAISEMLKSPDHWYHTMSKSTRIIAKYPQRVFVANGVGHMLRDEVIKKSPIKSRVKDMIDFDITNIFRNHIRSINHKNDVLSNKLNENIKIAQELANRQYFHGAFHKDNLVNWVNMWKDVLKKDGIKELKRSKNKLKFISDIFENHDISELIFNIIKDSDVDEHTARILAQPASLYYLLSLTNLIIALKWAAMGGIESTKKETITNELADADYVACALLFGGIITYESSVQDLYQTLKKIVQRHLKKFKHNTI